MRRTRLYAPTLREPPKTDDLGLARLLRGGYLRLDERGRPALLPLGTLATARARKLIEGALAPLGPLGVALSDPTQGALTRLLRRDLRSYRELPLVFEAASGDILWGAHPEGATADAFAEQLDAAVSGALAILGLPAQRVDAVAGNALLVPEAAGPDSALVCASCGYGGTPDVAGLAPTPTSPPPNTPPAVALIDTPGVGTVADVTSLLGVAPGDLAKTLIVRADGAPWAVMAPGERDVSLPKVAAALGVADVTLADDATVTAHTHAPVGFAGPVGLALPILADPAVATGGPWITGANAADAHHRYVTPGRDFEPALIADVVAAGSGDRCPECEGRLAETCGRIVARVTRPPLGQGLEVSGPAGPKLPVTVTRLDVDPVAILFAVAARHGQDTRLAWPSTIAPFDVAVLPLGKPGDEVALAAEALAHELERAGRAVLLDDRKERPGSKFHDAELAGHPVVVVLGRRGLAAGEVELRIRATGTKRMVTRAAIAAEISTTLAPQGATQ